MRQNRLVYLMMSGLVLFVLNAGCDIGRTIRIKENNPPKAEMPFDNNIGNGPFTMDNVLNALEPVINKHNMSCYDKTNHFGSGKICKTWPGSYSYLFIGVKNGKVRVIIDDISPFYLWTPQPFSNIAKDVSNALILRFGMENLHCGKGFIPTGQCEGWPIVVDYDPTY